MIKARDFAFAVCTFLVSDQAYCIHVLPLQGGTHLHDLYPPVLLLRPSFLTILCGLPVDFTQCPVEVLGSVSGLRPRSGSDRGAGTGYSLLVLAAPSVS